MPKYRKGVSGNPSGRPPGIKDRRVEWRKELTAELPAILSKLVEQAKEGDTVAAGLILSRCAAPLRAVGEAVTFALPEGGLSDAGRGILAAIAAGQLAPDTGASLVAALSQLGTVIKGDELARRIAALELRSANDENA